MASKKPKRPVEPPPPRGEAPLDEVPRDLPLTAGNIVMLASCGLTRSELAIYFDVSEEYLADRYPKALDRGRARRTVWLRKLQMKSAEEGNVSIQIMLGKQELKQGEEPSANEDRTIRRRAVERTKQLPTAVPNANLDASAQKPEE